MAGLLGREKQERQGRKDRVKFPMPGKDAVGWNHKVRFIRLGKNADKTGYDITYKYIQHRFEKMAGQAPIVKEDGSTAERYQWQYAYCLGSPTNPFTQLKDIPVNDAGIDECRSIVLPNGVPLHDIDQGGTMMERCLVWSWTNGSLAILERKVTFFDALVEWVEKSGMDPFFYSDAAPGYDVILSTTPSGAAYKYTFDCVPGGKDGDISVVKPLMQQQFDDLKKALIPVRTKEQLIASLGIGDVPRGSTMEDGEEDGRSSGGGAADPFGEGAGAASGSVSRADTGGSDALDVGDDL